MSTVEIQFLLSPGMMGLLGLLVGSFLNVVAHRMPLMMERQWWGDVSRQLGDLPSYRRVFGQEAPETLTIASSSLERAAEAFTPLSLVRPRSRCPACGHTIAWHENIPLISWLLLRARCSACGTRISARYPIVEGLTGLLFAATAWQVGPHPTALLWCAVVAALIAASLIDWDTTLLPDDITLPLMWGGLLSATLGWTLPLETAVAGATVGYLSLWSVYWLFKLVTGKEGMGYGDFKLLAALGAWLGWQAILPIILMASVVGAVVGIGMKFSHSLREGRYVPFGPFLAGGGLIVMLVGVPRVLEVMGWR